MIAQRFRAVGHVALVASAATGLYLISLQVAAERGKLEAVERQITATQRDMRQLQTELGTRASLRQLERWNGEVLALSAPRAAQYVKSGAQLVALDLGDTTRAPNAPPPVMMAALPKAEPVEVATVEPTVEPAVEPPVEPTVAPAVIRKANYVKPPAIPRKAVAAKVQRIAMIQPVSMRDVARIASVESRKRP